MLQLEPNLNEPSDLSVYLKKQRTTHRLRNGGAHFLTQPVCMLRFSIVFGFRNTLALAAYAGGDVLDRVICVFRGTQVHSALHCERAVHSNWHQIFRVKTKNILKVWPSLGGILSDMAVYT